MKLLLSHRFFWPDSAPYGTILRDMAVYLAKQGHEVHVQSTVPSYRAVGVASRADQLDGVHIYRCGSMRERGAAGVVRVINTLHYVMALFFRILWLRPQVVTASTFPPVVAAWAAAIAAQMVGARFVYHVQDIHPEVSQVVGGAMGRAPWFRLFRAMDNATLRRAACVVTLSDDMAETLRNRGVAIRNLMLIANPPLADPEEAYVPPDPAWRKYPGKQRAIFAGNLGRFQNLPLLAEGVALLFPDHPELELVFLGDGAVLPALQAKWGNHPQVQFLPYVPISTARILIAEADIGLASLQPGMYRVASPSKVQTYIDLGLPVMVLAEPHSHLAKTLEVNGQGVACAALTPQAIADAVKKLLSGTVRSDSFPSAINPMAGWSDVIAEIQYD